MKKVLVTCGIIALSCASAHAQVLPTPGSLSSLLSSTPWTNGQGKITGQTLQGIHTLEQQILNGMGTWDANGNYASINLTGGAFGAGGLARAFGFEPSSTITVPNLQELDAIRITGSFVVGQSTGTGVGGQFAGMNFQETLAPGSDHSANMYGVIGAVNNNGLGSVKAIYGRANCSNVQYDPTYSTCVAGVFNVNTGINQNFVANIQMNAVTNASGKAVNDGIWLQSANPDGSPALYTYGFLIQNVAIQAGGAAFQANAIGQGDFLNFNNAANNAHIFEVDAAGQVGAGMGSGGFGLGENLSVFKFGAFGTPGAGNVQGLIGDTGQGVFFVGTPAGIIPLGLFANNALQAYVTTSGLTVGGSPTNPNGITIGQATIARNVAAGNLAISSGLSASLSLIGGTTVQIGAPQVQFTQLPTSPPSGTSAGHMCRDTNGTIYGCT